MSERFSTNGRLIQADKPINFYFNGKQFTGYKGDTLASALLANDRLLLGRSFKYHRPRGVVSSGPEEPNFLVNLGTGNFFEPNQRGTMTEVYEGLSATSQNHFPTLEFDIGEINSWLSRFLPAGFYYKMFIHPRPFWKYVYEPFIRMSAGLGRAPEEKDGSTYEHFHAFYDVVIVGGGVAGLQTAIVTAKTGVKVLLIEQQSGWGGRAQVDEEQIDGFSIRDWVSKVVEELKAMPNVSLRTRMTGAGVYDHGYFLGYEQLNDHTEDNFGPRHRLWKVRSKLIVCCTGAIERPLSFAGNDIPGVLLASAVRDYALNYGVSVGKKTVVVTNNDDAYKTAIILKESGFEIPVILDAREHGGGEAAAKARALGIRVEQGKVISRVTGRKRVTGIHVCLSFGDGETIEKVECDAVAMSGGWSPVVHLWSHCGGKLEWKDEGSMFCPDKTKPPTNQYGDCFVETVGLASGKIQLVDILREGSELGVSIGRKLGGKEIKLNVPQVLKKSESAVEPFWFMPKQAKTKLRNKTFLDFQNDVKITDVELAAREGFESVEHLKRYTTLGMATDQGKLSNINGLAVLANALSSPISQVGTTTFRPPYTPISMGSIAGSARDSVFQPVRMSPIHSWHMEHDPVFEPVGLWRRPYCFLRKDETVEKAVNREILQTRSSVGILDASTLGKLIVSGPDAGKFLDMIYTNMMSNLKPGKCRYGLMCSENGFLIDDGVVARLDENTFLCHTTTGGAERIHAHMEEWLQTEWWDWKVFTQNVTEQYAQIAVVGPNARMLLEKLGGTDISKESLGFMEWVDAKLGGFNARIFRISFSGELSFEISVRSSSGLDFWNTLLDAGSEFDVMPYGTEALHVMRAEKGFIMIGDETDGTIIPQDLNLNWAISKKKSDFIGKRAHDRMFMKSPIRWKLVGLETLDGSVLPDGSYAVDNSLNANGQKHTIGRVTSTYFSPTLKKGIAMGLVQNGPDRLGEILNFERVNGEVVSATIVDPVFYDKSGSKQNV